MIKLIISISAIIFFTSCEKRLKVDMVQEPQKLVLHSVVTQDSLIEVQVTKSIGITDPESNNINDNQYVPQARVVVFENEAAVETLSYNPLNKKFKAVTTRMSAGKNYRITAEATGYTAAQGKASLLPVVPVDNVFFKKNARMNEDGDWMDEVKIVFTDPVNTDNYYRVYIKSYNGNDAGCIKATDIDIEDLNGDGIINPLGCISPGELIVSDKNFNGLAKTLVLYVRNGRLVVNRNRYPYLLLQQISKDFFLFTKSLALVKNIQDNPFAEPVNLWTNITNGYGIFTGISQYSAIIPAN